MEESESKKLGRISERLAEALKGRGLRSRKKDLADKEVEET